MIPLTRLNGDRFILNAEIIRSAEENPDTVVTLIGGEKLVVRESLAELVRLVIDYRRHLRTLGAAS